MADEVTTTTQNIFTQNRLPSYLQQPYEDLAANAQDVSQEGYSPYGGPRVAGATGFETAAQQGIGALGMGGGPWQTGAASAAQQGAIGGLQGLGDQVGGYDQRFRAAGQQGMNQPTFRDQSQQGWQDYMNPYTQNVTNILQRQAQQYGDVQRSELGSRAAAAGSFGGSRHGLGEQSIDRDVRQQMSDIGSQGLNAAFDRGTSMFNQDRDAGQRGQQLNLQALQGGVNSLGQQANVYGQQANIGQQLANTGQMGQDQQYNQLNQMENAGARQRAMQQAGLDVGYQDFQNQESYGRDQLSWLGSILGGFNQSVGDQNQQQNNVGQNPGLWQSLLGTGVAGLGTYNATR